MSNIVTFKTTNPAAPPPTVDLDFHVWEGPPPPVLQPLARTFQQAGTDGYGVRLTADKHAPATARVTKYYDTFANAMAAMVSLQEDLLGEGPMNVVYFGEDWETTHNTKIAIVRFQVSDVRMLSHVCGTDFNYSPAARLVADMDMVAKTP